MLEFGTLSETTVLFVLVALEYHRLVALHPAHLSASTFKPLAAAEAYLL